MDTHTNSHENRRSSRAEQQVEESPSAGWRQVYFMMGCQQ